MGSPWDHINWRRFQPSGWPFRDDRRVARLSPFTCLLLIILVPILLLGMSLIWGAVFPAPTPTPRVEALANLSVGDCFSGWDPATAAPEPKQTQVRIIECDQPHESELVASSPYSIPAPTALGPDAYPGRETLEAYSAMACREFLPQYVGAGQDAARLVVTVAIVSESEWRRGDMINLCIASFPVGMETGSIREPAR